MPGFAGRLLAPTQTWDQGTQGREPRPTADFPHTSSAALRLPPQLGSVKRQ